MVSAYILVQTEVGKASQVTDQIKALGGVVNATASPVRTT